jgi:SAM-dependent methyltransferase
MEDHEVTTWLLSLVDQQPRLTLSSPLQDNPWGDKVSLHPVVIKGTAQLQITWIKDNKAFHRNIKVGEIGPTLKDLLATFQNIFVSAATDEWHLTRQGSGSFTRKHRPAKLTTPTSSHNRHKQHAIPEGKPDLYMIALGLMSASGKLIASKAHKFRQINRFLELVAEPLEKLAPDRPIHIVDLGCGKAYLTFALYHYLTQRCGRTMQMTGVDLKTDVLQECQMLADKLGYDKLHFHAGSIESYQPAQQVDAVVSLHACNTATDAALAHGVAWNAQYLFAAPCCQKELYPQIANDELATFLRHGILKERFAALATDAARADLLEAVGYRTQVIEFIDLEHSPKNLLLRAERNPSPERQKNAMERYQAFKKALHINPTLERLLITKKE